MSDLLFGLDSFGDVPEDDAGALVTHAAAIRQVVDEAVRADEWKSTRSPSASTTGRSTRSRRPRPCSPRSPHAPRGFASAPA